MFFPYPPLIGIDPLYLAVSGPAVGLVTMPPGIADSASINCLPAPIMIFLPDLTPVVLLGDDAAVADSAPDFVRFTSVISALYLGVAAITAPYNFGSPRMVTSLIR